MKKILMLVPLLVLLIGCSKTDDMSSAPADTNAAPAATNAPAQ